MRTRAERRDFRKKAIKRKKRICNAFGFDWYPHDGQYSKGKIHCSCPMCAFRGWDKNEKTQSDKRKIEKMNSLLKDYYNDLDKKVIVK